MQFCLPVEPGGVEAANCITLDLKELFMFLGIKDGFGLRVARCSHHKAACKGHKAHSLSYLRSAQAAKLSWMITPSERSAPEAHRDPSPQKWRPKAGPTEGWRHARLGIVSWPPVIHAHNRWGSGKCCQLKKAPVTAVFAYSLHKAYLYPALSYLAFLWCNSNRNIWCDVMVLYS